MATTVVTFSKPQVKDSKPVLRIAFAIFLLAWPAQIANPIAAAAITWVPTFAYPSVGAPVYVGTASVGSPWDYHTRFGNARLVVVHQAAALAALGGRFQPRNTSARPSPDVCCSDLHTIRTGLSLRM